MPRRKTGRRRGRPYNPHARRHKTTRRGRRGLPELVDPGSPQLRRKKRRATGREDLELTGAAVLFGHGLLDELQHDMLAQVTLWLQCLARSLGPHSFGVDGLWTAIAGAGIGTTSVTTPVAVGEGAAHARYVLDKMLRRLDGSRDLVVELAEGRVPDIVVRVIEHRLTPADNVVLDQLRAGLDRLSGRR